jgi:O-antigen ligase
LAVGVFAHAIPLGSLVGAVGQHNGWLLWAVVAVWFLAGTGLGSGTPFRAMVWSVALLGALAGVFALLDAVHLVEAVRYSPEIAGLMESSVSLGQVLLVGIGAATALLFMERLQSLRLCAGVMVLVQAVAVAISGARTAQAALVAAVVLGALWVLGERMPAWARKVAWALVALGLAGFVVGIVVVGWLGPAGSGPIGTLLTDRPTIWHSALSKIPQHLLVGAGPDRFTAIVTWSPVNRSVTWQTTSSPHNVLFDWLLSGGVVALLAFFSAFILAGRGVAQRLADAGPGPKALALGAGAWAVSLLMSWTDPLTACAAAFVVGALLSDPRGALVARVPRLVSAGIVLVGACVVLVLASPLFVLEQGWSADSLSGSNDYASLAARWEMWPDPAFGGEALRASLASMPGSAQTAGRVASEVLERTPWDVNGVIGSLEAAVGIGRLAPNVPHPSVSEALAACRKADPASGIWDELARIVGGK